jgi:hypothetical protein
MQETTLIIEHREKMNLFSALRTFVEGLRIGEVVILLGIQLENGLQMLV